ncbi:MAG: type II secretion system protein E [Gemmatimonadota bacterium]|nr:MAG: type II secretion system protein E [Gemmatimonadota bacterium]
MSPTGWNASALENFVPDEKATELVPRPVAARYGLVPLAVNDDRITLGMRDPDDLEALDYVQMVTRRRPEGVLLGDTQIHELIDRIYGPGEAEAREESIDKIAQMALISATVESDGTVEMPVVRLFDRLMADAVRQGATDLHLQPGEDELAVAMRVDGLMSTVHRLPAGLSVPIATRIKVIGGLDISERRLPQDGKISLFVGGRGVDLRISTLPTVHGENVVVRILQQSSIRVGLMDLGFRERDVEQVRALFRRPHGIVLASGPTGSGKTTTLYAALSELDCEAQNVMTLEDPVEYRLPRIRQSQINERAGLTFSRGLRALMRQDPDVILVGEMRDKETTEIAVRAALTGHLVLSTIHTNGAIGTVTRLRNLEVEPFLISATLAGVVSQRLARRVCPSCRESRPATDAEKKLLGIAITDSANVHEGKGCDDCGGFGMKGRRVVYELLVLTEELSEAISQGADEATLLEVARKSGFVPIREHARELVLAGEIPIDAMSRVVA